MAVVKKNAIEFTIAILEINMSNKRNRILRGLDTFGTFSTFFKEDNICDFSLAFLSINIVQKGLVPSMKGRILTGKKMF